MLLYVTSNQSSRELPSFFDRLTPKSLPIITLNATRPSGRVISEKQCYSGTRNHPRYVALCDLEPNKMPNYPHDEKGVTQLTITISPIHFLGQIAVGNKAALCSLYIYHFLYPLFNQ